MTQPTPPTDPYVVVVNDVGVARHHGSKMVTARLIDELSHRGLLVVTIPAGESWRDYTSWIDGARAVVVNGEGTLHHSAPAAKALLAIAPYAQARAVPAFLVNSIWQDNSSMMAQQAKAFTAVYVRESRSQKQLADAAVTAQVVPDLVLGWKAPSGDDAARKGVIVTDSVVLADTQQLAKSAHTTGAVFTTLEPPQPEPLDYTDVSFIRLQHERRKDMSQRWKGVVARAYRARGAMYTQVRRWRGRQVEFSLEDFFTILRHSELLITGRFHAVCMAMVTGTPFLAPSSNSHKIDAMLEDAGLANRVISSSVVREAVLMPPGWSQAESQAVARYVEQAVRAQSDMFDTIAQQALTEGRETQ